MPLTHTVRFLNGVRFFNGRLHAAAVVLGLATVLSFSLADLLQRVESAPRDLVGLAGEQLKMCLIATVVGAGSAATVAARHRRRAGRDYWVTAATPPLRRCLVQFLSVALPVLAGWLIFIAVTSVRLGRQGQLLAALAVVVMSVLAASVGVAFGQVVGLVVHPLLAGPVAVVSAYGLTVVVAAAGDDSWWQWLGPGFGDGLSPRPKVAWLAGETIWFCGLTALFVLLASLVSSRPRSLLWPAGTAVVALLVIGLVTLAVNGPDAAVGVVTRAPR